MKHKTLSKERAKLRNSISNTDCTKGLEHFQNNLVFKVCELGSIGEEMAQILDDYAGMMRFGETYNKICDVLARLNNYHERNLSSMKNGTRFDESIVKFAPVKKQKEEYHGKIFGLDQKEIASMQRIKELS